MSAAAGSATPILRSDLPTPDPPILLIIQSLPNSLNVLTGAGLTPCMLFSSCYTGFEIISAWHYRDNLSLMQTCVFTILESLSCYSLLPYFLSLPHYHVYCFIIYILNAIISKAVSRSIEIMTLWEENYLNMDLSAYAQINYCLTLQMLLLGPH